MLNDERLGAPLTQAFINLINAVIALLLLSQYTT